MIQKTTRSNSPFLKLSVEGRIPKERRCYSPWAGRPFQPGALIDLLFEFKKLLSFQFKIKITKTYIKILKNIKPFYYYLDGFNIYCIFTNS
jgi:hypothetical protein